MSLVLNTNTSWWDNILSNQYLETNYPDIDNSILLFPDRRNYAWTTLATINWITATMLWWVISKESLYNLQIPPVSSSYEWQPPRVWTAISSWNNNLVAVLPIDWLIWSTIWKKIVLPTLYMQYSEFESITCKTWILHSDWTITYFHEAVWYTTWASFWNDPQQFGWGQWSMASYSASFYEWNPTTKYITTNWIVVQAWDRPIFQIISTQGSLYLNFWSLFYTNPKYKLCPVQISID